MLDPEGRPQDHESPRALPPARMPEITEENLVESQARVRAQLVARYELMWAVVEARIEDDRAELRPLDPRLLEIGKGILKEETILYRLTKPPTQVEEDPDEAIPLDARRELVAATLDELEAKREAQKEEARAREEAKREEREAS